MKTLVLKLAYDGTRYAGMQRQPNAITVEEVLVRALEHLYQEPIVIVPAGRTDAGVHARGMVIHTRLQNACRIPSERIASALNSLLPPDVRVHGVQLRDDVTFHARYDAISRSYSYTLTRCNDPLYRLYRWYIHGQFDEARLMESGSVFIGTHDFTTYSKHKDGQHSYLCTVEQCYWYQCEADTYRLIIRANRFVYGMVRALVGAMLNYARGRCTLEELMQALEARDRSRARPLAPPHGLVFESVEYPPALAVEFYEHC